jgi:hypothetical protein
MTFPISMMLLAGLPNRLQSAMYRRSVAVAVHAERAIGVRQIPNIRAVALIRLELKRIPVILKHSLHAGNSWHIRADRAVGRMSELLE